MSEEKLKRGYSTSEAYRAYIDGNHDLMNIVLNLLVPNWRDGNDKIDLDVIRDFLVCRRNDLTPYLQKAQALEAEAAGREPRCNGHCGDDNRLCTTENGCGKLDCPYWQPSEAQLRFEHANLTAAVADLIKARDTADAKKRITHEAWQNECRARIHAENQLAECQSALRHAEGARNEAISRAMQFDRDSRQLGADRAQYKMDLEKLQAEHSQCSEKYADKLIELSVRGEKAMKAVIVYLRHAQVYTTPAPIVNEHDLAVVLHELIALVNNNKPYPEDAVALAALADRY